MADIPVEGGFWLPSEFLTDDDILMDIENLNKNSSNPALRPNSCFPNEFPYDCGSFGSSSALSSPVESVFGSTETESDEEDLLSGLTRHLARSTLQQTQKIGFNPQKTEKTWVFLGSPQSTLSAVQSWSVHGSPNGPSQVTSPELPATPLSRQNDAWDLIYAAAGQVSRLKMNSDGPPRGGRDHLPARRLSPAVENPNKGFYDNQYLGHNLSPTSHFQHVRHEQQVLKQQCSTIWERQAKQVLISHHNQFQNPQFVSQNRGERVTGGFQSTGSFGRPLQAEHHRHHHNPPQQHGGFGMSGAGVKKQCAGTGVFLPRGYGNTSDNTRKNPGCSTALIPARVVQALNKSFEDMNGQPQPQLRINEAVTPDYDAILAERKAMLAHQRRSIWPKGAINHEMVLPQEWTY